MTKGTGNRHTEMTQKTEGSFPHTWPLKHPPPTHTHTEDSHPKIPSITIRNELSIAVPGYLQENTGYEPKEFTDLAQDFASSPITCLIVSCCLCILAKDVKDGSLKTWHKLYYTSSGELHSLHGCNLWPQKNGRLLLNCAYCTVKDGLLPHLQYNYTYTNS